ncbi:MAG: hypothetical protein A2V81_04215 [Candidatus Abawacabacteria bacterium RBG_16_42_10]|uniref:PpiC domain-containing protein n=1 Tax=Candidatus Abawacabacteria bacterium RBG_16_42_10 TaxID=1817814 RepID=A0A1F4XIL5_9BACT|nr:MAG: hypothetical protein A2V81_04215 [Candidatus Abawacabacteria bacterium RBG_16_42_10]
MTKRLLLIFLAPILALSACSLEQSTLPQYKVTYQAIRAPDAENISLDQIRPILQSRLEKFNLEEIGITQEGETLVAHIGATRFDKAKATTVANPFYLMLQESRTEFTSEEKKEIETYNAKQKELLLEAHKKAQENPDAIETLVLQYHEKVNLLDKGIRGPSSQAKVDSEYWPTLLATDAGKITEVIERRSSIWFAKVLEKKTVKTAVGDQALIRYQEITRFYKDPKPRLDQVPVAHFSKYIEKALVEKKDPNSKRNKNYLIAVYMNEEGKKELERISEEYKGKELRFFIDRLPHARVTYTEKDSSGILKIDDAYNQQEAEKIAVQLNMAYLPVPLSATNFEMLNKE